MKADPSPFRITVGAAGGYAKKVWIIGENEFCPSYGLLLVCHSEKRSAEESALIFPNDWAARMAKLHLNASISISGRLMVFLFG
jgi:hypothetical protein